MPAPAWLLIGALTSGVLEGAVGADMETAAGRAPVNVGSDEQNSVTFTLIPGLGLQLRDHRDSIALSYTPRIFYRLPNALGVDRPLVLHQLALDHSVELDRRTTWQSTALLSVGELDYTAARYVFAPGSTTVPDAIAEIVRVQGQTGFVFELGRRTGLDWDFSVEHTTPIGDQPDPTLIPVPSPEPGEPTEVAVQGGLPASTNVSTEARLGYLLTRRDRFGLGMDVTYQYFSDSGKFLLFSPDLFWEGELSRRTTLALSGGLAYVITLDATQGLDESNSLGGTGSVELGSTVWRSRQLVATLNSRASLEWYFDPIAGTSQPRLAVETGTDIEMGRDWLINPRLGFYALLRDASTRIGGTEDQPQLIVNTNATALRLDAPFRYRLSRAAALTFGARAALRGRELSSPEFRLTEEIELWAFVGLTIRVGTSNDLTWLSL